MTFELDETQVALRESVRRFALDRILPTIPEDDEAGRFRKDLFQEMGQMGFTAVPTPEEFASMDPLEAGITQIKAADPSFREKEFVKGARAAFETILQAFARADATNLKSLLDNTVYENFAGAIQARTKAGHELETTIVGIGESEIVKAEMDGNLARVTVKFVTEQVNSLKDAAGEIVEGDPANVVKVSDIWTFCRNTKSSDPNWLLVATGGEA